MRLRCTRLDPARAVGAARDGVLLAKGACLGTKATLTQQIHEVTNSPWPPSTAQASRSFLAERIRCVQGRRTQKVEDKAYCLLGIFGVFMPFIYGERGNALYQLQKEIDEKYGAGVASALNPP